MNKTLVLIPHYNNNKGLYKSIKSISAKENVDVLIIDDGSVQNKIKLNELEENKYFSGSLILIENKTNNGIEVILNQGLAFASEKEYKYIARLDAGDICHKNRFRIQEDYMENNPDIYLLGTQVNFTDSNGNLLYKKNLPTTDEKIRQQMYINYTFIHPSVIFRTEVIKTVGKYPTVYKSAEDFAYFFNITKKHKVANLDLVLLDYEINFDGISLTTRNKQIKNRIKILYHHFDFSLFAIYGLIINYIILFTPVKLIQKLKNIIYK